MNIEIVRSKILDEKSADSSDIDVYRFEIDYGDRWNDYGIKSILYLDVFKNEEKIIEKNYFNGYYIDTLGNEKSVGEARSELENDKTAFLEGLITLGTSDLYKELFKKVPKDIVHEYLKKVKDIAFDEKLAKSLDDEDHRWPMFIMISFFRRLFDANRWSKYGNPPNLNIKTEREAWEKECAEIKNQLNILHAQIIDGFSRELKISLTNKYFFKSNKDSNCLSSDIILKNDLSLDPLPTNCFALIGPNGVGKTTLLRSILDNFDFDDSNNSVFSQVVLISFDVNSKRIDNLDDTYRKISIGINMNNNLNVADALVSIIIDSLEELAINHRFGEDTKFKSLQDGFANFDFDEEISIVAKILMEYVDERSKRSNENTSQIDSIKEKIKDVLKKMSAGQKMIIGILICLSVAIMPKSLILIDEPENSLHPPFIMALIDSISILAKKQDSMVIMSTHSPIIIQELIRENVLIMSRNSSDKKVLIKKPSFETFAASIDSLNDYIFGLDNRKSGYMKFLKEIGKRRNEYSLEEIKNKWHLTPYAMSYVANIANKDENNNV